MNETPRADRIHIGIFGRRNAGKSTLANAVTGQELSVVSGEKGTTTDPVYKAMELLPAGPVVIMDTPGYDDEGELGGLRMKKTMEALDRTDVALVVIDGEPDERDQAFADKLKARSIPTLTVMNERCRPVISTDAEDNASAKSKDPKERVLANRADTEGGITVNAKSGERIEALKEAIARLCEKVSRNRGNRSLMGDLVNKGDLVLFVIPIDESAPAGRLILPQQQALREVLDAGGVAMAVRDTELALFFGEEGRAGEDGQAPGEGRAPYGRPSLVVTDSQVFALADELVPDDIPLTSFSILMARKKGFLKQALEAVDRVDDLADGDRILIAEGCTHHRQCEDIGTVKIPGWLRGTMKGKGELQIDTVSGRDFPEDLSDYRLVIHCGGCMIGDGEMITRRNRAVEQGVPFVNYGVLIAHLKGVLERAVEPLK